MMKYDTTSILKILDCNTNQNTNTWQIHWSVLCHHGTAVWFVMSSNFRPDNQCDFTCSWYYDFSIITFITSFKDNCVITLWPLFIRLPPWYKYHPSSFHALLCAAIPYSFSAQALGPRQGSLHMPQGCEWQLWMFTVLFCTEWWFLWTWRTCRIFCFLTPRLLHQAAALF